MKNLSYALLVESVKLENDSPWLFLYDITFPSSSTTVYLVKNNENVTYKGIEYVTFPLELGVTTQNEAGDIQTLELKISNVTRVMQSYLEQLDGIVGATVKTTIVHSANLSEDYSELERTFEVISSSADAQWVTFQLGIPNPLVARYPHYRYIADYCNWKFKGAECGYAGVASSCARNLDACRALGNQARYGGHKGLANGGLIIAVG